MEDWVRIVRGVLLLCGVIVEILTNKRANRSSSPNSGVGFSEELPHITYKSEAEKDGKKGLDGERQNVREKSESSVVKF